MEGGGSRPGAAPRSTAAGFTARHFLIGAAAVAVLAVALRLVGFTDPWSGRGADFHSLFGAFATGGPARNFAEHGFTASLGMPYDWRVVYADGSVDHGWYAHHPALYMWIAGLAVTVFGPEAFALRIPALVFSLFAVAACALFARELSGRRAALVAALLAAALPLGWRAGMLPWTEVAIAGCLALAARYQLRFVRGGGPVQLVRAATWIGAATLFDWPAHFGAAALFFHVVLFAREHLRIPSARAALCLYPAVSFAAIGLHRVHMALALGHEASQGDKLGTLDWVTTLSTPLSNFLWLQALYLERYQTAGGLVLVALGLGVAIRGVLRAQPASERASAGVGRTNRRAEFALLLALAVPGVLYIALFPARSVNHDFFFLVSLPFVAAAGAEGYGLIRRRGGAWTALVVVLAVAAHGIVRGIEQWRAMRSSSLAELVAQPWLQRVVGDPRAVVLAHLGRGTVLPFYARAAMVHSVNDPAALDAWRTKLIERIEPDRPLYFFVDGLSIGLLPEGQAMLAALAAIGPFERHDTAPGGPIALVNLRAGPP